MKPADIQRDIAIPAIHPPDAKETAPWREYPLTIIIVNRKSKTQDPQGAFTEASDRISPLNRDQAARCQCPPGWKICLGLFCGGSTPKSLWKTPRPHTNHSSRTSRHTRMAGGTRQTRRHNHTLRLDGSHQNPGTNKNTNISRNHNENY